RARETGVARHASGVLDRSTFGACERRDVAALDEDRPAERTGGRADEAFVLVGRAAQLMIEMDDAGEPQIARGVERVQRVQQRYGVGTARDGGDEPRVSLREIVIGERAADEGEQ